MLELVGETIMEDIERFGQITEAQVIVMHPEFTEASLKRNISYLKRTKRIVDTKETYYRAGNVGKSSSMSYVKEDCLWAVLANIEDRETGEITKGALTKVYLGTEPATYMHIKNDNIYYTLYIPEQSNFVELVLLMERLENNARELKDKTKIILVMGSGEFRTDVPECKYPVMQVKVEYENGIRGTKPEVSVR